MSGGSIKRLMREFKNSQQSPIKEFLMYPCEDNMFEWHFTMMGPPDSPYAEGFYHGRILVPTNYPFAPPDVVLISPNGRFELEKRICLSISSYHPENWHPTWGIPTVLHALREFMLTPGNNAIGAIDYPDDVKLRMATQSCEFVCPDCEASIAEHKATLLDSPPATEADKVKSKDQALSTPDLKAQNTPKKTDTETTFPSAPATEDTTTMALDGPTVSDMSPLPPTLGEPTPMTTTATESPSSPTPPPAIGEGEANKVEKDEDGVTVVEANGLIVEKKAAPPAAENREPLIVPNVAAEAVPHDAPPVLDADAVADAPIEPQVVPAALPAARQMQQGGWEINISTTALDRILLFLFVVIFALTCKKVMINHATAIWTGVSKMQEVVSF